MSAPDTSRRAPCRPLRWRAAGRARSRKIRRRTAARAAHLHWLGHFARRFPPSPLPMGRSRHAHRPRAGTAAAWLRPGAFFASLALRLKRLRIAGIVCRRLCNRATLRLERSSRRKRFLADWAKGTAISAVLVRRLGTLRRRHRATFPARVADRCCARNASALSFSRT